MIVGLGNPGAEYKGTRHNVGFLVIDQLATAEGITVKTKQKKALTGSGYIGVVEVLLAKPTTYMNLSGDAIHFLRKIHKIPMTRTLVVCDNLDLPLAKVQLKEKGSHRGHNGLRSVIFRNGGSNDFARISIGIGRPPDGSGEEIPDYVLGKFRAEEVPFIEQAADEAVDIIRKYIQLSTGITQLVSDKKK